MTTTIRDRDRGAAAVARAIGVAPHRCRVGIMGKEAGATKEGAKGLSVAEVAEFHEFGLGVPERSWLRAYVDEAEPELRARLRKIADAVARGRPLPPGLEQFGLLVQAEIQRRMASGPSDWKKLSPEYVERMGKTDDTARLIHTGQMRSSITFVVEPSDGPEGVTS